ncbi:MAG TPA: hypothetical protein PLE61_07580 [Vicinamibacterales bacterium]|nr:hypothetical protein [Vicinamibacterales bacterium]HPW20660.1 hypothetical protein [Vicinamibacterales bacterium]
MRSRGVRVLVALLAAAALAASGAAVWRAEQQLAAGQAAAEAFDHDLRQVANSLGELRAAQFALVAHGQPADAWLSRSAALKESLVPSLESLHAETISAEGQGALEAAIEAFTAFGGQDARAREYLRSGQVLSASDVVFGGGAPLLDRVVGGLDMLRGQESIARAIAAADARRRQLIAAGAGLAAILVALLLLVPVPRRAAAEIAGEALGAPPAGGLGLSDRMEGFSREAPANAPPEDPWDQAKRVDRAVAESREDAPAPGPGGRAGHAGAEAQADLPALADVCSRLARVQYSSELPGLLERASKALGASGMIVWLPDTHSGLLRPALSHGYTPAALARMGGIQPSADNAVAAAFLTKEIVTLRPDAFAKGAVVAPLHTAEGCSGALAVELMDGIEPAPPIGAAAAIVAAQLATLLTPAAAEPASGSASAAPSAHRAATNAGKD